MQNSEVSFLTDLTRTPKSAPVLAVIASTFPTPFAVLEPLCDLLGVQLPEFFAGIKVVLATDTIRAVRFGLGFDLRLCRPHPGWPFRGCFLSVFEPHLGWLLLGLSCSLTSLRSGCIRLIQCCYLLRNLLCLRLHLQPVGQVLQGVGSVCAGLQNAISQAVLNKVNPVAGRHFAEKTVNMGTAVELVSILSLEGLQHAYQGMD